MNQFIPVSTFLRKRLARRSFDNVEEFRQLLRLERLVLRPPRARPAESDVHRSARAVPGRNQDADLRGRILGLPPDSRNIAASPRFRCTRLSSGAGPRMGSTPWRERAAWIAAGGQP